MTKDNGSKSAVENRKPRISDETGNAFHALTGVDLALISSDILEKDWQRIAYANPVCRSLIEGSPECAACRASLLVEASRAQGAVRVKRCFAGLTVAAMSVTLPDGKPAALCAGPVILKTKPTRDLIGDIAGRIGAGILELPGAIRRRLARSTPMVSPKTWRAAVALLPLLAGRDAASRRQSLSAPPEARAQSDVVFRVSEIIRQRFREDLSLAAVAREVGVSPCHLSRLFKAETGANFNQCVRNARVAEMKRQLLESDVTITTAIFDAGFQSISQANRAFRAATGVSPRAFRGHLPH